MNEIVRRIVIFLVRKRLGLKTGERFRFNNQKSTKDWYMFTKSELLKYESTYKYTRQSSVSINWLLSDKCKIHRVDK